MADINDRLQRLSRRDELSRRVLQHRVVPQEVASVGADFLDVIDAVANVVRRHPGMSVMLAPGDGRHGGVVVRVTELHGDAEVALVSAPPTEARRAPPARRDDSVVPAGPAGPAAAVASPGVAPPAAAHGDAAQHGTAQHGTAQQPPARPGGAGHAGQPAPVWRPPDRWPRRTAEQEYGEPEYGRQQHERQWSG
jgi:hypothetical protein